MTELFDIGPSYSPEMEWRRRNGIKTRNAGAHWVAWIEGELLEFNAPTEEEAVYELAKSMKIQTWQEEQLLNRRHW